MFRIKAFFLYLIAGLVVLPWNETSAQQRALLSIQILASGRLPGTSNSTTPQIINSHGDIAGSYVDSSAVTRGFVRLANGNFTPPIVDSNDTGNDLSWLLPRHKRHANFSNRLSRRYL